ncbi:MAG: YabP/YqfC family sporulation protein [Clostridia bacterium]|nr:YabP/YqfC family sporulation protein [Clostridia bacterium]
MQTGENVNHGFTLTNRSHAEISGVNDVDCFNEEIIVLDTALGAMTITGSSLNISCLSKEQGRVVVDGEFDSVEYSGRAKKGGFFGRILR